MESCCLTFKLITLLYIFSMNKAATPLEAFLLNKRFFVNNLNSGIKMSSRSKCSQQYYIMLLQKKGKIQHILILSSVHTYQAKLLINHVIVECCAHDLCQVVIYHSSAEQCLESCVALLHPPG